MIRINLYAKNDKLQQVINDAKFTYKTKNTTAYIQKVLFNIKIELF